MTVSIPQLRPIAARSVNGFPRYSPAEMARRHAFLDEMLDRHGLACVAVTGQGVVDNPLQYFTNWPGRHPSFLLYWPGGETELIARLWNHLPNAREIAVVDDLRYGGDTHAEALARVEESLRRRGAEGGRVGLVGGFAHWDVAVWNADLPGLRFVNLNPDFHALRRLGRHLPRLRGRRLPLAGHAHAPDGRRGRAGGHPARRGLGGGDAAERDHAGREGRGSGGKRAARHRHGGGVPAALPDRVRALRVRSRPS